MSQESIKEAQEIIFQRWKQAFLLWKEARKNYFEPDSFCVNMQACITQIRTISFIMQSNKEKIDSFDEWYFPWQAKMKSDNVMKWLKDSRNQIEKQGDLEKYSIIQLEIIASYFNNGPKTTIPSKNFLFQGIASIFSFLKKNPSFKHFETNGVLKIQRQWFANSFKEKELLSLLSYGLCFLLDIIHSLNTNQDIFEISHYRELLLQDSPMSLYMSVDNGELLRDPTILQQKERIYADKKAVERRYPLVDIISALPQNSLHHYVIKYMEMAKYLLKIDKSLANTIFLSNMDSKGEISNICVYPMNFSDKRTKYLFMRFIAQQVKIHKFDTIIAVTESWYSTRKDIDPITILTNFPHKREVILVVACNSRGEEYTAHQEFTHKKDDIVFVGETIIEEEKDRSFFIAPIKEIWKNDFN